MMLELLENNMIYVVLGLAGAFILLFILVIVLFAKNSKLKKKYRSFMSGKDGATLEDEVLTRFREIDELKSMQKVHSGDIEVMKEAMQSVYQKIGVVKYDAFKEMGGKLSFVLALLDNNNSGILMNSVHSSREGCYIYLKEIIKGQSFIELSEDEKEALNQAINSNNYMA